MDIFFLIALVLTSIIALTFIVERGFALRWHKIIPQPVQTAVQHYRSGADLMRMRVVCDQHPSPIARLLNVATEHLDWPREENSAVLETRARHEVARLERGLVVLEIIVGIAPLLGLVGTIYGLIIQFKTMGDPNTANSATFALGIGFALNATLIGLLVAIPALVSWSYYSKKIEHATVEMESLLDEFLRKHYRSAEAEADAPTALRKTAARA